MYGRTSTQDASQTVPASSGPVANGAAGRNQGNQTSQAVTPWVLLALVVAYFAWGLLERHKWQEEIQPKNIGINLRNIAVVLLEVLIGVNLLKIAAAKYCAWGLPGGQWIVNFVGSV